MLEGINDILYGPGTPVHGSAPPSNELGAEAFMRLLIEQLKNQDPTAPVDNQQYIAQLAQFSSLEQMQDVNENLVALAALQQENALMAQLTSASALIGSNVEFIHPESGETQQGTVGSVRIEGTLAVLRINEEDIPLANVTEILGSQEGQEEESAAE